MTITARFSSTCPRCFQHIEAGERVEWNPGEKAKHLNCQPAPVAVAPQRIAVEEAGVYILPDGGIVKMQANRAKTATYPLRWKIISGERSTEANTHEHGEYEYLEEYAQRAALLQTVVTTGRRMTLEEARAFIIRFGICARCGRGLKAAKSVDRGIGPVCIRYFTGDPATLVNATTEHQPVVEAPAARRLTHRQMNQYYFVQNQRAARRPHTYEEIFGE